MNDFEESSDRIILSIVSSIINRRNALNSRQRPPAYNLDLPYYVRHYYRINTIDGLNLLNEGLLQSFNATNSTYKKVLSEDGEKQLKKILYDPDKLEEKTCPILHTEFEPNEEITMLPCNHYFNTKAIEQWLKEEKAECPICRCSLNHIEKKNENQDRYQEEDNNNLRMSRINLYNSLARTSHPFSPRFEIYYENERDLDEAINSSLR